MKKIMACFVALMLIACSTTAFAAITDNTAAGQPMSLTDSETPANGLTISFSPSVNARYVSDANDAANDVQWYAIATYHSSGTEFYGASNDSTALYKQDLTATVAEFGDLTIPTTAVLVVTDEGTGEETETEADSVWTTNGWSK